MKDYQINELRRLRKEGKISHAEFKERLNTLKYLQKQTSPIFKLRQKSKFNKIKWPFYSLNLFEITRDSNDLFHFFITTTRKRDLIVFLIYSILFPVCICLFIFGKEEMELPPFFIFVFLFGLLFSWLFLVLFLFLFSISLFIMFFIDIGMWIRFLFLEKEKQLDFQNRFSYDWFENQLLLIFLSLWKTIISILSFSIFLKMFKFFKGKGGSFGGGGAGKKF